MSVLVEPVQRGGAGVADRSSGATAGPACAHGLVSQFTFAISRRKSRAARAKIADAVAEYLCNVEVAVVVEEQPDEEVLRLTVVVDPPRRLPEVEAVAVACPCYVAGTFGAGG